ncbi:MAG: pentapeptide repeat-containing protein [Defluviitaleaceae bacterium]|nr:pentapeptide repeat-containing protein [Defluviitaleaceae bacterium]
MGRNKKKGVLRLDNAMGKSNVDLRYLNFERADCYRTNFSNSIFENLDMRAAKFKFCNLSGANLKNVNLTGANLKGSDLTNADLTGANLKNCKIEGANFRGAIITDANFEHVNKAKARSLNIDVSETDQNKKDTINK